MIFIGANMNKKIFGIRIGTVLTAILCALSAIAFWLLAKYNLMLSSEASSMLFESVSEGII
jgi:hypothetical protein